MYKRQVVVAGIAFTMPQMMMRLFTDNAELIRIGASYLRVMGVTYLCWGITEIYLAVLRSLGRVTISMAMNMMAFALNVFQRMLHFWPLRISEAWSNRCCNRNGDVAGH